MNTHRLAHHARMGGATLVMAAALLLIVTSPANEGAGLYDGRADARRRIEQAPPPATDTTAAEAPTPADGR